MKVLILKPSSLGDVVQALPVLRLLKAHRPQDQIYWWISAELRELLQDDPDLSGLFLFDRQRWGHPKHWGEMLRSLSAIRRAQFDCVLDLQGLARSGLVSWLAAPRLSIGVEDWREGAPGFYDVVVPRPSRLTHAVDWYLQALKKLAVPTDRPFTWMPEQPSRADAFARKWRPQAGCWLAVVPGARWLNKRWPAEYFDSVLHQMSHRVPDLHFAILGGRADQALGARLAQSSPTRCLDLTGRTTLSELVDWTRFCRLMLSNDTGPMHIAAALGKPVVSMFGPTEPRRTGPYGQEHRALRSGLACAPCLESKCHHVRPMECLTAITPDQVCAELDRALGELPPVE